MNSLERDFELEYLEFEVSIYDLNKLYFQKCDSFLGYTVQEIENIGFKYLIANEDRNRVIQYLKNSQEEFKTDQLLFKHKDGNYRLAKCRIHKLAKSHRILLWTIGNYHSVENSIDTFSKFAHDLRSPVSSILGLNQILKSEIKDLENFEELDTILTMISQYCNKSLNLTSSLMDLALLRSPDFKLDMEKMNLAKYLNEYVLNLSNTAFLKNNFLEFVNLSVEDVIVNINYNHFNRVLDNIISNSVKFSKENTPICITLISFENECLIEVKDQGIGIPQEIIDQLFVPFGKSGRPGLKGEKSNGLGMSVIKQIIQLHEGSLEVESEENLGTTIKIGLNLVRP